MYLVVRNIDEYNYLTAHSSKEAAQERLSVFENDGYKVMLIECEQFDYCGPALGTPNGLTNDHPSFIHLRADFDAKTIEWDLASIANELEQAKQKAIHDVLKQVAIDRSQNALYSEIMGVSMQLQPDNDKHKALIDQINGAQTLSELNSIKIKNND